MVVSAPLHQGSSIDISSTETIEARREACMNGLFIKVMSDWRASWMVHEKSDLERGSLVFESEMKVESDKPVTSVITDGRLEFLMPPSELSSSLDGTISTT